MDLFEGWGPPLARAALVTIEVSALSGLVGILFGLMAAILSLSGGRLARWLVDAYTTVVRSLPQLLLILMIYFGSSHVVTGLWRMVDPTVRPVSIPPLLAGVFALALIFGAYATEVLRGAFLAVPPGQIEAARACGMSEWQVFRLVKLPQMIRYALPGLGNIWVSILKDTSLISIVGLEEIMRVSELATSRTHRALFFYLFAAAMYFAMTLVSDLLLDKAEKWSARGERRA